MCETSCPELIGDRTPFRRVDLAQWSDLHEEGRRLIGTWLRRAIDSSGAPGDPFEGFIYLWIAFNGWACCVTEQERDRNCIDALALHAPLSARFAELTAPGAPVAAAAADFFGLMPIFKASSLRAHGIYVPREESRGKTVDRYLKAGASEFDPKCYLKHRAARELVPCDWAHALVTIYRVRNNLFHGQKTMYIENDRRIVSAAYRLLLAFVTQSRWFTPTDDVQTGPFAHAARLRVAADAPRVTSRAGRKHGRRRAARR